MAHENDEKATAGQRAAAPPATEARFAGVTATLPGRILLGLWALLLVLLILFQPVGVNAQETGVTPEQMQAGTLLLETPSGWRAATRIDTDVDIAVSGPVARTRVRQRFGNDGTEWTEAVYVFPLPEGAAVDRLRIEVGERVIEGEIREREAARRTYEQAKSAGVRSGLVEQQRANLFTTSLANLAPGETVTVEIGYLETPRYDDGAFSLRLPTTLTPRYIPGSPLPGRKGSGWAADTDRVPDASLITPPVVVRSDHHKLTLTARIDAGVPLASLDSRYHRIAVRPVDEAGGVFDLELAAGETPMIAEHLPDLQLILHSRYAVEPLAGLQAGTLDVAFMRHPDDASGLEVVELMREQIVIVLPSHHALARRKRIPVKSLDDLPCITMRRSMSPALHDATATLYREARIRMHAVSSADNVLGHLQLVQEGLGFALLPDSVCALLPQGVTFRPLDCDPVPTVSIALAFRRGNASRLVREFVGLARRCCATSSIDVARLTLPATKS